MSGGNPQTLVPSQPGNTNAVRSGIYSATGRVLAPRAEELARTLMAAPHTHPLDSIAAEEIGALLARLEALDAELATARGKTRQSLLDFRLRATRQLRDWLREFGATPKSRAEWAREMAQGGLATEIARRRAAAREEADRAR